MELKLPKDGFIKVLAVGWIPFILLGILLLFNIPMYCNENSRLWMGLACVFLATSLWFLFFMFNFIKDLKKAGILFLSLLGLILLG